MTSQSPQIGAMFQTVCETQLGMPTNRVSIPSNRGNVSDSTPKNMSFLSGLQGVFHAPPRFSRTVYIFLE